MFRGVFLQLPRSLVGLCFWPPGSAFELRPRLLPLPPPPGSWTNMLAPKSEIYLQLLEIASHTDGKVARVRREPRDTNFTHFGFLQHLFLCISKFTEDRISSHWFLADVQKRHGHS